MTDSVARGKGKGNGNGATQQTAEHAASSYSGCEQHALNHVQSDATGWLVAEARKRDLQALENELRALQDHLSAVMKCLEKLLVNM